MTKLNNNFAIQMYYIKCEIEQNNTIPNPVKYSTVPNGQVSMKSGTVHAIPSLQKVAIKYCLKLQSFPRLILSTCI